MSDRGLNSCSVISIQGGQFFDISSPFVLYQDFMRAPTNEGGQSYPFLGFGKEYLNITFPTAYLALQRPASYTNFRDMFENFIFRCQIMHVNDEVDTSNFLN